MLKLYNAHCKEDEIKESAADGFVMKSDNEEENSCVIWKFLQGC
jgi:hypothetical protein